MEARGHDKRWFLRCNRTFADPWSRGFMNASYRAAWSPASFARPCSCGLLPAVSLHCSQLHNSRPRAHGLATDAIGVADAFLVSISPRRCESPLAHCSSRRRELPSLVKATHSVVVFGPGLALVGDLMQSAQSAQCDRHVRFN